MANLNKKYYFQKVVYIKSLLNLLPFGQWNTKLLALTDKECNFAKGYNAMLFPNGLKEVVEFCEQWQDQQMLENLEKINSPDKIREKVALALKTRIKSYSRVVQLKNTGYFAAPDNVILATKIGWRTCDIIWHYAGDKSLDFNYYSKRGLLLTVYLSAILFYIQDESEDYTETDKFIDKSIANIINGFTQFKNLSKLIDPSNIPIIRMF